MRKKPGTWKRQNGRMPVVLVTGMSGTGKSSALAELARRGHRVVDTDDGGWIVEAPSTDGRPSEPLWREDRIAALLAEHDDGAVHLGNGRQSGEVLRSLRRDRASEQPFRS
jgi:NAD(P)-dependent dehydrogenase (short-subunit alcohol dehydrogenase family)